MALEPVDRVYGADLRDPQVREDVWKTLREAGPRLVLVEFPCTYWSQLTRLNFRTNSDRQRLKKLRESHRPFTKLAAEIAEYQMEKWQGLPAGGWGPARQASVRVHGKLLS